MIKKIVNKGKSIDDLETKTLSTEEVLSEVAKAVLKEKLKRKNAKKEKNAGILKLGSKLLVRSGETDFAPPMHKDLATLKCLIQTIVRDELRRSHKNVG